jgi:hypothetical protein
MTQSKVITEEIAVQEDTNIEQPASLLEASRRVDWRFLLPDPTLGAVALTGKASNSLRQSLSLFSHTLTQVEAPLTRKNHPFHYDVVVICGSLVTQLASALHLVKPGGFVYIEFTSYLGGSGSRAIHPLAHNVNVLKKQGFTQIQCHWHSPNFEACKRIIPLDDLVVLGHILNKSDNGIMRLLTKSSVSIIDKSGLLNWSGRALSLIAQRGTS